MVEYHSSDTHTVIRRLPLPNINVDLQVPGGMTLEGTSIPDDMRAEEIIEEVVNELDLPRVVNERSVTYTN